MCTGESAVWGIHSLFPTEKRVVRRTLRRAGKLTASSLRPGIQSFLSCTRMLMDRRAPQPYAKDSAFCWPCFSDSSSLGHGKGSVCGFTNSAEQQA